MNYIVEVCATSVEDCIIAQAQGAHRIELNSALSLGGLTPSLGSLIQAKKVVSIPIIVMIRCRPGGFCYTEAEIETMIEDARQLIKHGADGIVFGFLNNDHSIDIKTTKRFVELAHQHQVEAIFHRAFDVSHDPDSSMKHLIEAGIDRVLTSGQEAVASQGLSLLKKLYDRYHKDIEFCVGSGVNESNVLTIMNSTGMNQVHSSFKRWFKDATTSTKKVSYRYSQLGDYEGVDGLKLDRLIKTIQSSKSNQ